MAQRQGQTNEIIPEESTNQYFNYDGNLNQTYYGIDNNQMADFNDPAGDNAFTRFFVPEIAENKEFARENYMMDKTNAFNEYMYNKANEYNSPAAQMQRAKEAGINLNLAAEGIMGGGNAVASPMQGAQGSSQMNSASTSPFGELNNLFSALGKGIEGANTLGDMLGFGKKNKAEIRQLNNLADKTAEEAGLTELQKRQYRRTMRLMYSQMEKDLEQTEQNIKNLQKLYENYSMEKWKIAADTNFVEGQTGETQERTKQIQYENWKQEFYKTFRELYGVQLNESDMSMLVQAIMSNKGDKIVDGIISAFDKIGKSIGKHIKDSIPNPKEEIIETTKETVNKIEDIVSEKQTKNKHDKIEAAIKKQWDMMPENSVARKTWGSYERFREEMLKHIHGGYSGRW